MHLLLPIHNRVARHSQLPDRTPALTQNINYGEEVEELKVYARN